MTSVRNYNLSFNVLMKIIIFIISCFINILLQLKKSDGFSTELIHINSPLSPFFNPNLTDHISTEEIESSSLIDGDYIYLMKISYGKPPVELYHIVDTGSELSWIQCFPCKPCFKTKVPPFNPKTSSTFKFETCPSPNRRCPYKREYHDNSSTQGDLAKETITIGSDPNKTEFKDFLFGCGFSNSGYFSHKGAGIVGFNRKKRSFITQLSNEHHGKFSYCMAPSTSTQPGKISFGNEANVSGDNVMTTPFIRDIDYKIMLTEITVGEEKLKYIPDSYLSSDESKVKNFTLPLLVDSGGTVIYLSNSFYNSVEKEIKKQIKGIAPITSTDEYRLCYNLTSLKEDQIPKIKLHFPGVVLELNPVNTFVQFSRRRCLAILPTNDTSVLGNMAQINFLVGFNLVEKKLSFKPTNCAAASI